MQQLLDELRRKHEDLVLGGGLDKIQKQKEKGKMSAWERIASLLDEDKPYQLITAREAIEVLDTRIQTNLPSNSTIIYVTLSYIKYKEWDEINIYLPVWNVVYQRSEGQTGSMLVDAIKGQVMER